MKHIELWLENGPLKTFFLHFKEYFFPQILTKYRGDFIPPDTCWVGTLSRTSSNVPPFRLSAPWKIIYVQLNYEMNTWKKLVKQLDFILKVSHW